MRQFVLFVLILFQFLHVDAQNEHPMKVAMVSVFVEDPVEAFAYYTEVLGFEEVMYAPESYIAIVRSPLDSNGTTILLEPTEPGGIEVAKAYKKELYSLGIPVITFSCEDIIKTVGELKAKDVVFKKNPVKTSYGFYAVFDDANGNYVQLIQLL